MLTKRLEAGVKADLEARREEFVFRFPRVVEEGLREFLNDPRDLPVAVLLLNIILTAIPGAVIVLCWGTHTAGAAFLACNYALYLQRFLVALLHVTEHRALFRKGKFTSPCISLKWQSEAWAWARINQYPA